MNPYMLLMLFGAVLTALSQVLLKQSANQSHSRPLYEFLNWRVLLSYAIFFGVLLLNTYAYTQVEMKYGAVIDTCSYLFVMLFSCFLLKERFTRGRILGNLLILTGILVYTLP